MAPDLEVLCFGPTFFSPLSMHLPCCRSIIIGELGAMEAQQRRRGKA